MSWLNDLPRVIQEEDEAEKINQACLMDEVFADTFTKKVNGFWGNVKDAIVTWDSLSAEDYIRRMKSLIKGLNPSSRASLNDTNPMYNSLPTEKKAAIIFAMALCKIEKCESGARFPDFSNESPEVIEALKLLQYDKYNWDPTTNFFPTYEKPVN